VVGAGDPNKRFVQLFSLFCSVPAEVSPEVSVQITKAPSCVVWFSRESTPIPTHSQLDGSQESPLNLHRRLIHQTRFYHIVHQAVPKWVHGCTVVMGARSMNRSLYLGMMSTIGFRNPPDKAPNCRNPPNAVPNPSPQILILHTNREQLRLPG
jgi:hypothetical protein